MVGGKVVGVAINKQAGTAHVSCVDPSYPRDEPTSIRVRGKFFDSIRPGDGLWWQCGKAYWTPQENVPWQGKKCGVEFDIPLEKIGYSH